MIQHDLITAHLRGDFQSYHRLQLTDVDLSQFVPAANEAHLCATSYKHDIYMHWLLYKTAVHCDGLLDLFHSAGDMHHSKSFVTGLGSEGFLEIKTIKKNSIRE